MKSHRSSLTLVLFVIALASLPALAQNTHKPPVTPNDPRAVYIVVLNQERGAEPEFDSGGAKLLARWSNRVVVELLPAALEVMKKHGRVKYAQHILNGPVTAATAPSEQLASASFVPRKTSDGGTLQWTTGDYDYDGGGNIDRIGADSDGIGAASDGYTRRFVYDEVDRLVEAGLEAPAAAPGTYTNYSRYTYDSFGNRLSEQTPAFSQTMTADKNTNRVTLSGTTVTYDGVGNMTQGGGSLFFQYDPFNNLKEVDSQSAFQKMAIYNADDERIIFCGDGSAGPCRWTLRGNGNEVLREYESGPIGNGNSYWSYYLWVEDSVYRGTQLAGAQRETAEGGRLNFHLDHLGSPRLTTNAAGQKVTANEFAPFGRELTSITQEAQLGYDRTETHRFTGHERDFVEGTISDNVNFVDYMHARTYLPVFGRFTSVDPAGESIDPVKPQSWNRYAYVLGNPLNFFDPFGDIWVASGNSSWTWADECGDNLVCRDSVATQVNNNTVRIYGSESADDVCDYTANSSGYIGLGQLDQAGTYYEFQSGITATYVTPSNAVAFYNTAEQYHETHPNDAPLSLNDAGRADGAAFSPHHTHDQGRAIDLRYMDPNGQPTRGANAVDLADDQRMRTLLGIAAGQGFNQNYTDNNVNYRTLWAPGHRNHAHIGRRRP